MVGAAFLIAGLLSYFFKLVAILSEYCFGAAMIYPDSQLISQPVLLFTRSLLNFFRIEFFADAEIVIEA